MNATTDLLRGELERVFELDEMQQLSRDLLGFQPEDVGSSAGKGAFARALVEQCAGRDALEALADAIVLSAGERELDERVHVLHSDHGEELEVGAELGTYRVLKKLGEGSVGVVYLGDYINEKNGKPTRAALKVVKRPLARDGIAVQRYLTVLRAMKAAGLPKMAEVVDVGILADGRPWFASRFVEGQTVAARVSRVGAMHFNEARTVLMGVLDGLESLHARGLVHGDVKAENTFIHRAQLADGSRADATGVLVDGGTDALFRRVATDAAATGQLSLFGSAKSIDPILARGGRPGLASDLYAVGVLLYEMLTGQPPFVGDSAIEVVAKHLVETPRPPSTIAAQGWVSAEVDELVLRMLSKTPDERFASIAEVRAALMGLSKTGKREVETTVVDLDEELFEVALAAVKEGALGELTESALDELEGVVQPAMAWAKATDALSAIIDALPTETVEEAADDEVTDIDESVEGEAAAPQTTTRTVIAAAHTDAYLMLLRRLSRIQQYELADSAAAATTLRRYLETAPTDTVALAALEELLRDSGDHEGVADLLLERAELLDDAAARADLLGEIAQVYETQLDAEYTAFVVWTQALTDQPKSDRIAREVERLAGTNLDRWNEAIAALSEAAQDLSGPDLSALYVRMGKWYAQKLHRPDFALQCYNQALQSDANDEAALVETCEIYRTSQSYLELATLLKRRADASSNPAASRDLLAEAADITFRKLGDAQSAQPVLEAVLESDPRHPLASGTLFDLLTQRGDQRALIALLRKRAESEAVAHRMQTLVQIGEIYEHQLDELDKAFETYGEALTLDKHFLLALKGQERVLVRRSDFQSLATNLETQLNLVATPRQKTGLLERLGALAEEEFLDADLSIARYEAVLGLEPAHEAAHAALSRLYRKQGRFDDLVTLLENHARLVDEEAGRNQLLVSAAKVALIDLETAGRAEALCARVLEIAPQHDEALDLMARARAATGDALAAVESLERMADRESDVEKRAALYVQAAEALVNAGEREQAIARFKKALDAHGESRIALEGLRNLYLDGKDAHGALALMDRQIASTEGATAAAALWAEKGRISLEVLDDGAAAQRAFNEAMTLDPLCTPAALGLGKFAYQEKRWSDVARFLEPLLARVEAIGAAAALEAALACGDAYYEIGELEKAHRAFTRARDLSPENLEVKKRLSESAFVLGHHKEAAALYAELVEAAAAEDTDLDLNKLRLQLGRALTQAQSFADAERVLEQAAKALDDDRESIEALRDLHEKQTQWTKVVRVLRRRMAHADAAERFELLVRVGDVLMHEVGDRGKAAESYVEALEVRADDRTLLSKLMALYSDAKDWTRLADILTRMADLVTDDAQVTKYLYTAASITHRELSEYGAAVSLYERLLATDPSHDKAFKGLTECLERLEQTEALVEAYRARLSASETLEAPAKAALWDKLADLLSNKLEASAEAIDALKEAETLVGADEGRTKKLLSLYDMDPIRHAEALQALHLTALQREPRRAESYRALAKLFAMTDARDAHFCVAQAMTILGIADKEEQAFYRAYKTDTAAVAEAFMTDQVFAAHLVHPEQDPLLSRIFHIVEPAVRKSRALPFEQVRVTRECDPETDGTAIAQTLHYAAAVLQLPLPSVYYCDEDAGGLSFLPTDPASIGIGLGAQADAPNQALAFVAGRHLSYLMGGAFIRQLVPTGSGLSAWLLSAIRFVQPSFPVPADLESLVSENLQHLKDTLRASDRDGLTSAVTKLLASSPSLDLKRWVAAVDRTADRLGLLLSNSLRLSSAIIEASPADAGGISTEQRVNELVLYSVSPDYLAARAALGIEMKPVAGA